MEIAHGLQLIRSFSQINGDNNDDMAGAQAFTNLQPVIPAKYCPVMQAPRFPAGSRSWCFPP